MTDAKPALPAPSPRALGREIRHLAGARSPGSWNNAYTVGQMDHLIDEAAHTIHTTTKHGSAARNVAVDKISHWLYHNSIYTYIENMHAATWRADLVWGILQLPVIGTVAGLVWSDAADIRLPALVLLGLLTLLILARYIAGYFHLYCIPDGLKALPAGGAPCAGCNGFDHPAVDEISPHRAASRLAAAVDAVV